MGEILFYFPQINKSPMIYLQFLLNLKRRIKIALFKINSPLLILLTLCFNLFLSLSFSYFLKSTGQTITANFTPFENKQKEFFAVVILAPLFETFFFQSLLIDLTLYVWRICTKKESILMAILIPSIFFGLSHNYNYLYVLSTFFIGLIFNTFYLTMKLRNQWPYIQTVILHALYNLCIFLLRQF
jgi:hypothetical protein